MNAPAVAFRFDVDTPLCIAAGVPALLRLAEAEGVRFTFFVNMGRAVSWPARFARRPRPAAPAGTKLGVRAKLGFAGALRTALLNPHVGAAHPDVVRAAVEAGHEVGLHGGRNHGAWQHGAQSWDAARLDAEIAWGRAAFERATGAPPAAFASPGWNGGEAVNCALVRAGGFRYVADRHGPGEPFAAACAASGLTEVRTALTGEPGGVGWLEWLAAAGATDGQAVARTLEGVAGRARAALYDHPCYAGRQRLDWLARLLDAVREQGAEVRSLGDLLETEVREHAVS